MLTFTVCTHNYYRNNVSGFGGELLFGGVDETRFVSPINWGSNHSEGLLADQIRCVSEFTSIKTLI